MNCICGNTLTPVVEISHLVFSNLEPFDGNTQILYCQCGLISKALTPSYLQKLKISYENYLSKNENISSKKSFPALAYGSKHNAICDLALSIVRQKGYTRILDYGCGDGSLLRRFRSLFKSNTTQLFAYDAYTHPQFEPELKIGVLVNTLEAPRNDFDLVTLIHTIEHCENPIKVINEISGLLSINGTLLIQCPLWTSNYFDLYIADHLFHFTEDSISQLLESNGFTVISLNTDLVEKEITVIACRKLSDQNHSNTELLPIVNRQLLVGSAQMMNRWLDCINRALVMNSNYQLGIYGLGIAGAVLYDICIEFKLDLLGFLDDDMQRCDFVFRGHEIFYAKDFVRREKPILVLLPFKLDLSMKKASELKERNIQSLYFDSKRDTFIFS